MAKGNDKRYNKKSRTQNVKTVVVPDKKVVDATELATNDRENEYGNEGEANALGSVSNCIWGQFPERKFLECIQVSSSHGNATI